MLEKITGLHGTEMHFKTLYSNYRQMLLCSLLYSFFTVISCNRIETPLEFPRDHGPHLEDRSEWWYFTGEVFTSRGETLGFEFTIFKRWIFSYDSFVYLGHCAVSEPADARHVFAETITYPPVAGIAEAVPEISINGFSYAFTESGSIHIKAGTEDISLALILRPARNVLLHGEDGVVLMGDGLESGYYSFTNLATTGTITVNNFQHTIISGRTWMDHQWGDFTRLAAMWDWFSLRFNDGGAFMLTQHRNVRENVMSAHWTYRSADGTVYYGENFRVETARMFTDENAQCTYPLDWTVEVPELDAVLFITPLFDEQSLYGVMTPSYWEGLCTVEGTINNQTLNGSAYVELCGYEDDQLIYTGPSSSS